MIRNKLMALPVVGIVLALGACANSYDIEKVSAMSVGGDAFASALHQRYSERALFERNEGNWESVRFFNERAYMITTGSVPALQNPSERNLRADNADIAAAYARLSDALKTNAPQQTPDACARAQTWFEHWMEQAEEGHQADHIKDARTAYEKAVEDCSPNAAFIVYFDFNSSQLSATGSATIAAVADAVRAGNAASVELSGHADRAGASDYNTRLANQRVNVVKKALAARGVKASIQAASYGEEKPAVATDDNVRNAENRRVEITISNK